MKATRYDADPHAHPGLHAIALLEGGCAVAVLALFSKGPPDTGWTFYVPFSVTTRTDVSITVIAAFILGMSSILTGLNFITTIHRLRVKGMGWFQIPLFA